MAGSNSDKVAIVTGAGREIGRAIALALAREGYALCLGARTREELAETRALSGLAPERSLIVLLDLAQAEAPGALITTAIDHYGRIDLIINNAGWAPARTALAKMSPDDVDRILAVNLRAPIEIARLALDTMTAQGAGTIINWRRQPPKGLPPERRFMPPQRPASSPSRTPRSPSCGAAQSSSR